MKKEVDGWMDKKIRKKQMDGWKDKKIDGWLDGKKYIYGWLDGYEKNGWLDG